MTYDNWLAATKKVDKDSIVNELRERLFARASAGQTDAIIAVLQLRALDDIAVELYHIRCAVDKEEGDE